MLPPRKEEFSSKDDMSSRNSESSLVKEALNYSIDSESTASTCLSRGSESDFEIEASPSFRFRQSVTFEGKDGAKLEPWPVETSSAEAFRDRKGEKRHSLPRSWFYRTFGFISTIFLFAVIKSDPMSVEEANQYRSWRSFLHKQAPTIKRQIRQDAPGKSFTILLKGGRLDFLQQSIDAHVACSSVEAVQIDFDGSTAVPETILARSVKVSPIRSITTSAVLLLSDDVILTCDELEKAFQAWKKDSSRLVGFFGYRQTTVDAASLRAGFPVVDFEPVATGSGSYSLVSDRAVFAHKLYISSMPMYNYHSSCCQLLLSLQVSAVSGKAPALIKAYPLELSSTELTVVEEEMDATKSSCCKECIPDWLKVNLSNGISTMT